MAGGRGSHAKRVRIRRELFAVERVCWLCLEPLDMSITDPRDPRFVVVDEELPVSKGGDPLDRSNCHLVHNRCNGRKGSRILQRGAFADIHMRGGRTETSRDW
ncbi:MAG: hypothetical protein IKF14_17190 [Atopobiaceae bacterium]|nr:hypothetical protein [Atopobiaceae bacterium]